PCRYATSPHVLLLRASPREQRSRQSPGESIQGGTPGLYCSEVFTASPFAKERERVRKPPKEISLSTNSPTYQRCKESHTRRLVTPIGSTEPGGPSPFIRAA